MAANSYAERDEMAAGAARQTMRWLAVACFAAFAVLFTVLGSIALFGHASDGDPVVRLELQPQAPPERAVEHKVALQAKPATNATPAMTATAPKPSGDHTSGDHISPLSPGPIQQTPPPPATPSAQIPADASLPPQIVPSTIVKPVFADRALIADPALIEQTEQGPLPRIADDGRTPMTAYAPPTAAGKGPRIAIVIGGLGISARATAAAIQSLPAGVTLAFAPYADDVQRWVAEARRQGHEVLLEVPMEPYDFPDSDPGPHTLRAAVGEESNMQRLVWSLTRFSGYAGVTNLLGGRLLADADSLEPVMTYLSRRGVLFFESGAQSQSVAPGIARRIAAPYVQSAVTLDTIQTGTEIDARLSELENLARSSGSAAGTGFLYPVTIDRVADWAKSLPGRGFVLVPVSAIVASSR
jgi:polysaccharide deacetylase 2 family uncharacterized protein YibQ